MKAKLSRLLKLLTSGSLHLHSGQYGEDVYLHKRFRRKENDGFYIDVGAHHPFKLSNTAYLWALGWNGLNADANPKTIELFEKFRPNDLNLWSAVVPESHFSSNSTIDFWFEKELDNCATCDPELAAIRHFKKKISVPTTTMLALIQSASQKFPGSFDLLNIDVEGLDEQIVVDMDCWPIKPKVIFIEIYSANVQELLRQQSVQQLIQSGYHLVGKYSHTCVFELEENIR